MEGIDLLLHSYNVRRFRRVLEAELADLKVKMPGHIKELGLDD